MYLPAWTIQRLISGRTQYLTTFCGAYDWTTRRDDADEFDSLTEAEQIADEQGGEPCEHRRRATALEELMARREIGEAA